MTTKPPIQVGFTPRFLKASKRLRKKYSQIGLVVQQLINRLAQGETPGDQIQGVGYTAYKTRVQNPDAQRGKSGGFRVIYYIKRADRVTLLMIYSKTEQVDISSEEIRHLIDEFETPEI